MGTLDVRQEIGSVDGLDEKIGGCRQSTPPELIVSADQESLDLALGRIRMGLRITPVTTISEAYQAATGQPLRPAR